ncbi:MAG TPA: aspartate--tRNA(Asn) ligase [Candidatus Copromonas faecavium]|uniref:Aspartate--tRNA(Asp/Asn) ligase n=1 Tax=Candidatus Copromonas faecavium (nom. illeg.) TaxID=2840740 RepID=A0A9D1D4P1_9FIRM|nr:aspartate--tRNA(Asn) ligase [Candidatus Copromonas faecavium]
MEFAAGVWETKDVEFARLWKEEAAGQEAETAGMIHSIRDMGEISFVILRSRQGLLQAVREGAGQQGDLSRLKEGQAVRVRGVLKKEPKAPHGMELRLSDARILSEPAAPLPLPVGKWKMGISLEASLDHRPIALRNLRERAVFKIQEGLCRGFREFLTGQGFTEIHTPKIGARSAEGGANLFKLSYFHHPAVLAQSPQFYKQMMVGVFDRVFEVGPVFRAEKHSTRRHLNEYTSMDFEMGFLDSFYDLCQMETAMLQSMFALLEREYGTELSLLDVRLPKITSIPCLRFDEAKRLVSEACHRPIRSPYDLEPEEEGLIGTYAKETWDSDFVFVTHYPSKKRPFYAMEDPENTQATLSFDLLFRGMEVTTGGQRIHDYGMLMEKLEKRGMDTEGMEEYLDCFRYGMPPHGGLGIGLERLTMQLLSAENIRQASLFPRDMTRLKP